MRHTIRPNSKNPDFPKKADPALLAKLQKAEAENPRKKALAQTQERVLAAARKEAGGCLSNNLDWIRLVGECRKRHRQREPVKVYVWVDSNCPKDVAEKGATVEVEESVSPPDPAREGSTYVYLTLTPVED